MWKSLVSDNVVYTSNTDLKLFTDFWYCQAIAISFSDVLNGCYVLLCDGGAEPSCMTQVFDFFIPFIELGI